MIDFEASNGAQVVLTNAGATGYILVERDSDSATSVSTAYLGFEEMVAWREFEQQRRDKEVGRWRWPENSDFVVYPGERGYVSAINERTGAWATASRAEGYADTGHGTIHNAIAAYFAAISEPKPWHQAIPGQAWVVEWTADDESFEKALLVADFSAEGRVFADAEETVTLPISSGMITNARRIYPEVAS
ncbi:hypothetical protein [Microbacterium sp. Leaf320]|uniref:hypothetical protein n=1 Tax=Microbacterium sp. Leaf320 TaxID=1736334 RepID=UPI0006F47BDC|nr:hypothetical protein [Microbacterium sp. Leaf320]KQQ65043.1 hypothetical protein ASF63_13810 [Microbacterium sp. Leaf320]